MVKPRDTPDTPNTPLWALARSTPGIAGHAQLDVIGLGEISLDQVCVVDDLPSVGMVDKAPLASLERRPGGTIATAVLGCARLGLRSGLIAATGDDDAANLACEPLNAAEVDLSGLRRIPNAATREAIILVDRETGVRNVLFHREARLALSHAATALDRREILRARALLLDTTDPDASLWAAEVARSAGIPVLLDADRLWSQPERLLSRVDFSVVSQRLAEEFGGTGCVKDGLRALYAHGATLAVATQGALGAIALSKAGWVESAGFTIEPVDTTGAGDAFRAGFVWGVLAGKSEAEILEIANAAGALNCLSLGAQKGLPSLADIEAVTHGKPARETMTMRNKRTSSGGAVVAVLALLLIVGGAGGYNYYRNLAAEQGPRPFKGYAERDLQDLRVAYGAEVDSRTDRYEELASHRQKKRSGNAMLDANIANFERVQRAGDQKRAVAGVVAENQARLREIDEELAYRDYMGGGAMLHIRRLTKI